MLRESQDERFWIQTQFLTCKIEIRIAPISKDHYENKINNTSEVLRTESDT